MAGNYCLVILIFQDLPPWMCIKQAYFMMSLLIPGLKQPKNNIGVYIQSLIDELQYLEIDGQTPMMFQRTTFQMHATLIWTINGFPTYADLSGLVLMICWHVHVAWMTYQQLECNCKQVYVGHHSFLENTHCFGCDTRSFDGTIVM